MKLIVIPVENEELVKNFKVVLDFFKPTTIEGTKFILQKLLHLKENEHFVLKE